jgi:hypothetical protein
MTARLLLDITTWFVLCYFIVLNCSYLALNLISTVALYRRGQEEILDDLPQLYTGLEPPISILVPAYNEEASIAASVRSMLQLAYSEFEIVVINDGSKDATLAVLKREFDLQPFPEAYRIRCRPRGPRIYRSTRHPNLRVIDKAQRRQGRLAQRRHQRRALSAVLRRRRRLDPAARQPAARDPALPARPRMVATGGTIRIANGCEVSGGFLTGSACRAICGRCSRWSSTCAPSCSGAWAGRP